MLGSRAHYLPLWSDDNMSAVSSWHAQSLHVPLERTAKVMSGHPTISQLVETYMSPSGYPRMDSRGRWRKYLMKGAEPKPTVTDEWADIDVPRSKAALLPPMIGRVTNVGRIFHYGSKEKSHKSPFYFKFRIKDASQTITVTVWNDTAAKLHPYFRSVSVSCLSLVSIQPIHPRVFDSTTGV